MLGARFVGKLALVLGSFFVSLILVEGSYRIFLASIGRQRVYRSDALLGWSPREGISYKKQLVTSLGRPYLAEYSTNQYGMRYATSSLDSTLDDQKVLVLGDSCTGDLTSSDNQTWFAVLHDQTPGTDFFVYGIGGSGTYQQYLAYQRISNLFTPDVLIIQHASNDPVNDSYVSSFSSYTWNQDLRRPYLVNGKRVFRSDLLSNVYKFIYNNSLLYQRLDVNLQAQMYHSRLASGDLPSASAQDIADWEKNYKLLVETARSGGVEKVASVSCSLYEEDPVAYEAWLRISGKLNVPVFSSLAESVKEASLKGEDVYFQDGGHFNSLGGPIAGMKLSVEMRESGFWDK